MSSCFKRKALSYCVWALVYLVPGSLSKIPNDSVLFQQRATCWLMDPWWTKYNKSATKTEQLSLQTRDDEAVLRRGQLEKNYQNVFVIFVFSLKTIVNTCSDKVILRKIIIFDVRELMMYILAEGLTTVLLTVCLSAGFNAFIYISHGGPIQYCFKFLGTEIR